MRIRRITLVVLLFALIAAACGSAEQELLPTAPVGGDVPPAAGACHEDEPDCNDTVEPGENPQDLPPPSDGANSGALVNGGLTVSEALATDATGVLAVQGFIVDDGTTAYLCEALAESLPPQCGGAQVAIDSYDTVDPDDLSTAQGVTWTDQSVVLYGDLVDGTLVIDPTVTG